MTKRISPVHPGAYLRELLDEMDISAYRLAKHIGVSAMRLSHVLRGQRPLSADLALRLERAFGQSAQYWMNLQARYDLDTAQDAAPRGVQRIERLATVLAEFERISERGGVLGGWGHSKASP